MTTEVTTTARASPGASSGSGQGAELPELPAPLGELCRARFLVDRAGDKWAVYVLASLARGEQRFTELKRGIGVSQRMLTVTLRQLERDGMVTRTVYSAMPPNIAYRLTPLGCSLWRAVAPLLEWAAANVDVVEAAQREYDARGTEAETLSAG
jgi:DNA-binding HxlR family transcriptional regulator